MYMKKWMGLCMAAAVTVSLLAGCGQKAEETSSSQTTAAETTAAEETSSQAAESGQGETEGLDLEAARGKHHVEITVKDYGTIKAELDGDTAPITVANFLKLAGEGFYDGLTFHRIISGFMIQGGDPLGNGMGGSDQEIKGEFSNNGVENPLSHTRGAISMARAQRMDSASSQFFIVHEDSTFLDGDYACFGYVTEGMEIVDAICQDTKVEDNNGTVAKENQPVIESVKVID
jgi:peptidyl-prolyl cis-trans isomerase B (cyclophilin B)